MSTPIFREIKRHYPTAKLTVLVQERCRQVIETNPFIDEVLSVQPRPQIRLLVNAVTLWSLFEMYFKHLRSIRFDIVLHPRVGSDAMNESLLIALIQPSRAIGYRDSSSRWFGGAERNHVLTQVLEQPEPENEVLSNAAIVAALTHVLFKPKTEVFPSESDLAFANSVFARLPPDGLVLTLGFGAMIERRRWPSSRWIKTIQILEQKYPISVIVLAARSDAGEATRLCQAVGRNAESIVAASILQVAACIRKSSLFLGTDSGLAHLAAAVGAPEVVVSPHPKTGDPAHYNSPVRFAPFGERVRVVTPSEGVLPCTSSCTMQTAHCILQITPEEVSQASIELLESSRSTA